MKIFIRILAVVLLVVAIIVVGYLMFTGSRHAATQEEAAYEQTT